MLKVLWLRRNRRMKGRERGRKSGEVRRQDQFTSQQDAGRRSGRRLLRLRQCIPRLVSRSEG